MSKIDLGRIIENSTFSIDEVAEHLFPTNKYPSQAIQRILRGEAFLNSEQLSKLAQMVGVSVSDLYRSASWHIEGRVEGLTMKKGNYTAILSFDGMTTSIYDGKSLFHEVQLHSPYIPMSEYLQMLNNITENS